MEILIIGGTGFISGRLVARLLAAGHHVTTFTRGTTQHPAHGHDRLTTVHGDRHDRAALAGTVDGRAYDAVYDMVAYTPDASRLAVDVFRGHTQRFIHCSTVSVYMVSHDVQCPITEDQAWRPLMDPWPRNPFGMDYGVHKRACEEVLWAAHDAGDLPVTMLRPVYVGGPHDPTLRDFFWIERILDGRPLLVPGSGDHAFQMVYVDDVARAFADLLDHPETVGEVYNVAGEEIFSLNEYLHTLGRLLDRTPECVHLDEADFDRLPLSTHPRGDVFPFNTRRTAVFSLDRIKRRLGYRSTPFDQWMAETIDWYRQVYDGHSLGYDRRDEEVRLAGR